MLCRTDSDSVIREFKSLHPSHMRYILCNIVDIYTKYSALFFVRKLYAKNCGVVCGVNCGVKQTENKPQGSGLFLFVIQL